MMLLMWILTKKHKSYKTKFLETLLGICLLTMSGCATTSEPPVTATPLPTMEVVEETYEDYSSLYEKKILVSQDTPLYLLNEEGLKEVGVVHQNAFVDLGSESYKNTVCLRNSSYYIEADSLQKSDRWFQHHNHLLGLQQHIVTNTSYRLENLKEEVVMTMNQEDTYEVYVLPGEEDPRYGVYFLNDIYYIPEEDIKTIENTMAVPKEAYAESIPVLMYHFLYDENETKDRPNTNYVEQKEYDEQLSTLNDEGYQSLTMREILYFMERRAYVPEKSFAITIDDGDPSVYTYGFPILKKYGMNATLFLIGAWEDTNLSWQNWEMREEGIELQSHSFDMHQGGCSGMGHGGRLLCVDYATGVEDTKMGFDYVDGGFVYCYPFGDVNEHAIEIIKDGGAKLAFTTEFGKINLDMDPLNLPRIRVIGGNGLEFFMKNIKE